MAGDFPRSHTVTCGCDIIQLFCRLFSPCECTDVTYYTNRCNIEPVYYLYVRRFIAVIGENPSLSTSNCRFRYAMCVICWNLRGRVAAYACVCHSYYRRVVRASTTATYCSMCFAQQNKYAFARMT